MKSLTSRSFFGQFRRRNFLRTARPVSLDPMRWSIAVNRGQWYQGAGSVQVRGITNGSDVSISLRRCLVADSSLISAAAPARLLLNAPSESRTCATRPNLDRTGDGVEREKGVEYGRNGWRLANRHNRTARHSVVGEATREAKSRPAMRRPNEEQKQEQNPHGDREGCEDTQHARWTKKEEEMRR